MAKHNSLTTANVSIETGSKNLGTASIKSSNSSHIVQVLVNTMYSNKEASSVREILSNAIDAHNMAKNSIDKVEIQIPTKTFPMLRIRDFGMGLSPDFMANEYLSLGHSEKRDRNDAVGFMGIGRFALFSLFKSYFLTSYYNGKKYPYSIHLDENGDISIELLDSNIEDTSEKNGVEIFVLLDDEKSMERFEKEIFKLTFFCKDKVNLVNIDSEDLPEWYTQQPVFEFNDIKLFKKNAHLNSLFNTLSSSTELIGLYDNIPYLLGQDFKTNNVNQLLNNLSNNTIAVINLPIGSVERTASRENLERDKNNKTIKTIDEIASVSIKNIQNFTKDYITSITNFKDLSINAKTLCSMINIPNTIKWTDGTTPHIIKPNGHFTSDIFKNIMVEFSLALNGRLRSSEIYISNYSQIRFNADDNLFVIDDSTDSDTLKKLKIKNYLQLNKNKHSIILFVEKDNQAINNFLTSIDAPKLSSFEKPVIQKKEVNKKILCFHMITENYSNSSPYSLNSQNIDIDSLKDNKIIYFPVKERNLQNTTEFLQSRSDFANFLAFLKTFGGNIQYNDENSRIRQKPIFLFCGLSEKSIESIKDLPNFYTWERFQSSIQTLIPINENHSIRGLIHYSKAKKTEISHLLKFNLKEIQDNNFVECLEHIFKNSLHNEPLAGGHFLINYKILKLYDDVNTNKIKDLDANFKKLNQILETNYPLALYNYTNENLINEVIVYMNAKFNELNIPIINKKQKKKK